MCNRPEKNLSKKWRSKMATQKGTLLYHLYLSATKCYPPPDTVLGQNDSRP